MKPKTEYPASQCDVNDKESLTEYQAKKQGWLELIYGSDFNSIWNQLHRIIWYDAIFNLINNARALSQKDYPDGARINGDVSNLIDVSFVTLQASAIRSLSEKNPTNPNKAVVSIRRLIDEVENSLSLITRENFVANHGRPYDPIPVREKAFSNLPAPGQVIVLGNKETGPNAWFASQELHRIFDQVAGTTASNRNRQDTIQPQIVQQFRDNLNICLDVETFADKFIAHFADPQNRTRLTSQQIGVTLDQIEQCHKALYQAMTFVLKYALAENDRGPLAIPQYDVSEYFDEPWVKSEDILTLENIWDDHRKKIEEWSKLM